MSEVGNRWRTWIVNGLQQMHRYHAGLLALLIFTPRALYVPNVAKRSIWDKCKKKYILRTDRPTGDQRPATDDRRPTNDLAFGKISNSHISSRGLTIHFMFRSTVGFSGSADRMALFPVWPNPRWWLGRHRGKFKWRYLCNWSSDSLHVWC